MTPLTSSPSPRPSPPKGERGYGFALAALATLTLACGSRDAGPIELKLGHVGAPGSLFAESAEEFARRANEALGDRARVTVFGSSQLGGDDVLLQKLKLGTADLALPSSIMSSRIAAFGLFDMPYLVDDREHMGRIEREMIWPDLAPLAEREGFELLAVWENGFRHITSSVGPIFTPEDLAGLKLRTPRGEWRVKMFRTWGANPTPLPLSEVFMALQTGVVDGQENPFAQIYASKLHEVQSHLSLTRHVYTPAYLTAGKQHYATLPPDVRAVLEQTARETQAFIYETATRIESDLLERFRAAGLAVNEIDREAFVAASRAVYDEFASTVEGGGELIERARALANN